MKDLDVSPVEKKREEKARKGELEEETKERKIKKTSVKEEVVPEESKVKGESSKKATEEKSDESKKGAKEKAKEKPKARKPKPIEKIKFSAKREVPEFSLKKKKPKFLRQEHYKKRLDLVWRKAIGIDSKQHEGKRGKGFIPTVGYKKPNVIQGMHPLGFRSVLIHNVVELAKLNPKIEGAIIAAAVGRRKRNEIIAEANKLKITILNPRKGEV